MSFDGNDFTYSINAEALGYGVYTGNFELNFDYFSNISTSETGFLITLSTDDCDAAEVEVELLDDCGFVISGGAHICDAYTMVLGVVEAFAPFELTCAESGECICACPTEEPMSSQTEYNSLILMDSANSASFMLSSSLILAGITYLF